MATRSRKSLGTSLAFQQHPPPLPRAPLTQVGQGGMWDASQVDAGLPKVWVDLDKE